MTSRTERKGSEQKALISAGSPVFNLYLQKQIYVVGHFIFKVAET